MNKPILIILLSLVFIPFSNAQKLKGNKNVIVDDREIEIFNTIVVKNNLTVILEESPVNKVRVETDENLQSAVITRVNNEVLEVYLSQEIRSKKALNIYIGVTDLLERIEAKDNAEIISKDEIHTGAIELITQDNSNVDIKLVSSDISIIGKDKSDLVLSLKADNNITINLEQNCAILMHCSAYKIDAKLTDSASLKPIGNCKELIINANSNVSMKGKDLLTDYAAIESTDRSNIFVNVSKELIISAENMTEIYIYDNPKIFIEKFSDKSSLYKK